jgi:hypothetical protein
MSEKLNESITELSRLIRFIMEGNLDKVKDNLFEESDKVLKCEDLKEIHGDIKSLREDIEKMLVIMIETKKEMKPFIFKITGKIMSLAGKVVSNEELREKAEKLSEGSIGSILNN